MNARLMRSSQNKVIGGVCGGIGEYFDIDPVFVRIVAVILAFANGIGFVAYIFALIIMPKREFDPTTSGTANGEEHNQQTPKRSPWNKYLPGVILIVIGTFMLARQYGFGIDWGEFWALAFIGAGLYFILKWKRSNKEDSNININVDRKNNQTDSKNGGQI